MRNDNERSKSNEHVNQEHKRNPKLFKRRSSLESGGGSDGGGTGDGNHLRRHKSLDGADQSKLQKLEIEDKDKDKKDPRLERRIRNKVNYLRMNCNQKGKPLLLFFSLIL